jgi:hypothetical protein
MDGDDLARVAINFNYATDGGLPVDCSGVDGLEKQLDAWTQEHYPDVHENAGDLEAYLIDEEGVEAVGEFMSTVSSEHYGTILQSLKESIEQFYGGPELEADGDPQKDVAIETLAHIAKLQKTLG